MSKKYYSVDRKDGRWRLIDGQGRPFYSLGVNCVTTQIRDQADYRKADLVGMYGGDREWLRRWGDKMLEHLRGWHFNTLGAWHQRMYWGNGFPKTVEIRCSRYAKTVNKGWGQGFPDVFDPAFPAACHKVMTEFFYEKGEALPEDEGLIGYFTDNELHWWGSLGVWGENAQGGTTETGIVDDYMALPSDRPGKQAWLKYLKETYGTVEALNRAWGSEYTEFDDLLPLAVYRARPDVLQKDKEAFLRRIAETYFRTTSSILKMYDPNHLNLGCRVVGSSTPKIVIDVMKKYVDVVSMNFYSMEVPVDILDDMHRRTDKPIMITEFSFCAGKTAGFPYSTNGARNVIVRDQTRRAEAYDKFVTEASRLPYMIGTHWFAMYDYGNPLGLIGNYGLLNYEDEPWEPFVSGVARTNARVLEQAYR